MNSDEPLRYVLRCLLCIAALVSTTPANAIVPEHTIKNGSVHFKSVGPDNPIFDDNDW